MQSDLTCSSNFSLESMITPRSLTLSTVVMIKGVLAGGRGGRGGRGGTCWPGERGGTYSLRRAFKGAPKKQHWGASYETGNSIVMLSFACHSPIILAKNE